MTHTRRFITLTLALSLCPMLGLAQTHAGLLEKGIFLEETAGDLDGAIEVYRQIVATNAVPRDIATQAGARLEEGLRRKGQAPRAAASLAQQQDPGSCCGIFSGNYDVSRPVTVTGTVAAVMLLNPQSIVVVEGSDGNKWGFTLASPNAMVRGGWNRNNLPKLGEPVIVRGYLATGVGENCPTALPNACPTLAASVAPGPATQEGRAAAGALHASALSINTPDGRNLFDRPAVEKADAAAREKQELQQLRQQ